MRRLVAGLIEFQVSATGSIGDFDDGPNFSLLINKSRVILVGKYYFVPVVNAVRIQVVRV